MNRLIPVGFVCASLLLGCSKAPAAGAGAQPSAAPSAAPVVAAAPSAVPAKGNPLAGKWKGNYDVASVKPSLATKDGAPRDWEADDGSALSGKGELELEVDADGKVVGTLGGPLGKHRVIGRVDGDSVRATLLAEDQSTKTIQNGALVLTRDGQALNGSLQAATGDGHLRRAGTISLKQGS